MLWTWSVLLLLSIWIFWYYHFTISNAYSSKYLLSISCQEMSIHATTQKIVHNNEYFTKNRTLVHMRCNRFQPLSSFMRLNCTNMENTFYFSINAKTYTYICINYIEMILSPMAYQTKLSFSVSINKCRSNRVTNVQSK